MITIEMLCPTILRLEVNGKALTLRNQTYHSTLNDRKKIETTLKRFSGLEKSLTFEWVGNDLGTELTLKCRRTK